MIYVCTRRPMAKRKEQVSQKIIGSLPQRCAPAATTNRSSAVLTHQRDPPPPPPWRPRCPSSP
eukprot:770152-Pyramimonas_sp.AAC.1